MTRIQKQAAVARRMWFEHAAGAASDVHNSEINANRLVSTMEQAGEFHIQPFRKGFSHSLVFGARWLKISGSYCSVVIA